MAVNTTLESTDEMSELIALNRTDTNMKALPDSLQKKFNELCQAQFTAVYPEILKEVRKELINA
jgi:hypothetical protein